MNNITFKKDLLGVQDDLLRFAYKLTSDREEANDLLQETSLKALDNEEKYTPDTNFKGWIYTIMRNIFINNYRKVVRDQTFVDIVEVRITTDGWLAFARTEGIGSTTASSIRRTSWPTPPGAGSSGFSPPDNCPSFSRRRHTPRNPLPTCSMSGQSGARFVMCSICTTRAPASSAAKSRWWMRPLNASTQGWLSSSPVAKRRSWSNTTP